MTHLDQCAQALQVLTDAEKKHPGTALKLFEALLSSDQWDETPHRNNEILAMQEIIMQEIEANLS